jgi:hypothetical protein
MSILCRLAGHAVIKKAKWNDGLYFSRCDRCGSDIVRRPQGKWKTPPKNRRVVWKLLDPHDIDWGEIECTRRALLLMRQRRASCASLASGPRRGR